VPLHVAFFNRSFHPDGTATGQLLTELCEDLVRAHGCRVSVVTAWRRTPDGASEVDGAPRGSRGLLLRRETHAGVAVLRARATALPKRRAWGRFANYVTYFAAACAAGQRLGRPDVVAALTDPPVIGLAAYLAARRYRAPFVFCVKDVFPEVGRLLEDFRSPVVDRTLEAVTRFLVRKADRVVALGPSMRRRLVAEKGADPARTVVIPDWADCSLIAPGPKRNPLSESWGLADRFVVMHSGNVGLSQGLETLVDAAELLRDLPDLVVAFVGDGVKRPALEERARALGLGNVRFLPYQPRDALAHSFATADVFVVSLRPGLSGYIVPSKVYGILAAGRPYVAATEEECEAAALARARGCGCVARPGDPQDLAAQVRRLHADPALRARMGAAARAAALEFDRPRAVRAYYELFQEVAAERNRLPCLAAARDREGAQSRRFP
jgi:colanic acid biosynthesis glycosyl transferase WcaI